MSEHPSEPYEVPDADLERVDELAHEFAERQRAGERVSIDEYAARFPELADEIRELFPTVLAMEKLTQKKRVETTHYTKLNISRLGDYRIVNEIARG